MKRLKKILKIGALCLGGLVAIWLIANSILVRITGSRLEERLAAIRAEGDPVTLADLRKSPPPPEQNAATVLSAAKDEIAALRKSLNEIEQRFEKEENRPNESEQKDLQAAFEAHPAVLSELREASQLPEYDPQLDYFSGSEVQGLILTEVQEFRECMNILRADARLLRSRGERSKALEDCLAILRLSRLLERGPTLIRYLVVVACRAVAVGELNIILRAGPVSTAQRAELDKELALCSDPHEFEHALKGERAFGITTFASGGFVGWPNRALFNNDECCYLDQINEQLALVAKPYADVVVTEASVKRFAVQPVTWKQWFGSEFHPLTTLFLPALMKTRDARDRVLAQMRCLRVLNAIQKSGPWKGKDPQLTELGLPADAITDPYDGSPIKLKRMGEEWLIFCVGTNLKNDGGRLEKLEDVGLGPKGMYED